MSAAVQVQVQFAQRAKRCDTETAERRRWRSRCGEYAIERLDSLYGLRTRWLALLLRGTGMLLLGSFWTREEAEARCQDHAETGR